MLEQVIGRGRFEVRATLGTGAFGTVFAAFDRERGHPVAIKRPHLHAADDLYRFKQEFRALADISHPNLVTLYELFEDAGSWFFTMELIDGVPLTTRLRRGLDPSGAPESLAGTALDPFARTAAGTYPSSLGRAELLQTGAAPPAEPAPTGGFVLPAPPLPDAAEVRAGFAQVARALQALHDHGMLHRDIKPSNVLATAGGRVVVLDFGLVRQQQRPADDAVAGTPLYMAPEPWLGEPVGEAADWYSLGVMLYEALLGAPPFRGTLVEIMQAKAQGAFVRPRERSPEVPADLDALCCELLRPLADARPRADDVLRACLVDADDEPATPTTSPPVAPVFVGRADELAALSAALAAAPAVVHLSGEPGIGKTALVQAFLAGLDARTRVLRGRCHAQESVPYRALDAVVDELGQDLRRRPAAERAALLPPGAAALARVFPVLERLVGGREADDAHPLALRRRAFAALRALLRNLAASAPLVVWIDDLQWGDADSAAVVHGLLRPPDPPPLLLVLSYRDDPDAPGPFLRELAALTTEAGPLPNTRTLALRRLPEADGRALVAALADPQAPPRRLERVLREAAGIPLLLDRLARAAAGLSDRSARTGDSDRDDGDGRDLLALLVDRQLAELPPDARRLLELVALAGAPLPLAALRDAAGAAPEAALKPLRARHLVRLSAGDRVAPAFAQVAAHVAAGLEPQALRRRHAALAAALERHDAPPRRVADHWHAAGDDERAGALALAAATRADAALAFAEAAADYRLALAWAPGDAAHQRDLRRRLADALVNAGRCREAAPLYLGLVPGAAPLAAIALRRLAAEQLLCCGELERGEAELRALARDQGLDYPDSTRAALVAVAYGVVRLKLRGTRFTPRPPHRQDPFALARVDTCLSASRNLSISRSLHGMAFAVKGLRLALECGEPGRFAEGLAAVGGSLGLAGDAGGKQMFEQAEALAASTPRARGVVGLWRGFFRYGEGRWSEARAAWDGAAALLAETPGLVVETLRARAYALLTLIHLGEYAELELRTAAGMALARETGNLYTEVTALMYSALPRLAAGDLPGARARVRESEARSPSDTWNSFGRMKLHVQCDLYAGDAAAALARLEAAQPEIEASRMRSFRTFRVVVGALHAGAALQVLADGAPDPRRQLLKTARRELARFEAEPMGLARGLADLNHAALADRTGDRAAAVRRLESAAATFAACECPVEAACARRRLGQLLGDADRSAAADAELRARGVADPARWTACFAPGFPNPDLAKIP